MKRYLRFSIVVAILCFVIVPSAFAQVGISRPGSDEIRRRFALLIGNAQYPMGQLSNPVNDIIDLSQKLEQVGFKVTLLTDATLEEMRWAIESLSEELSRTKGVGLFYFSGYGLQMKGKNYLLPIGLKSRDELGIRLNTVNADSVLQKMESAENATNIFILDAYRHHTLSKGLQSAPRGLAPMTPSRDSLIAFAATPGSFSVNENQDQGVFSKYIIKHIENPDLKITELLNKTVSDVGKETNRKQIPWISSALSNTFYFVSAEQPKIENEEPIEYFPEDSNVVVYSNTHSNESLVTEKKGELGLEIYSIVPISDVQINGQSVSFQDTRQAKVTYPYTLNEGDNDFKVVV